MLALYALLTLSIAVSPAAARFFLERFHLRSANFLLWALTAPTPWMYNFENRALTSLRPLSTRALAATPDGVRWVPINHQPAHVMTFVELRARAYEQASTTYVYLESRYREQHLQTTYALSVPPRGAEQPWQLRRMEPAP